MARGYEVEQNRSYRVNDEGERDEMANFEATILEEVRYEDGMKTDTVLTITGLRPDPEKPEEPIELPAVEVPSENFASMGWVMSHWGSRCVIRPGSSVKDDLRAFIQLRSTPKITTVYRHLGWTTIDGKRVYVHAGGGIGRGGNNKAIRTSLPNELSRFDLSTDVPFAEGVAASLDLLSLAKPEIMWPLLAATLAPVFAPVDFGIHLAGRTGTYKSEVMSLMQSHFGKGMDARHLPGSWSSTPNALEAQAFLAKDAAFVIDDFVPSGTSYQVRQYQQNADKIFRAQGNQAGRARLNDVSALQQTMYPRGIILSTGEDVPEGHSVRARMLIMELTPGDITPQALSLAQSAREKYSATIAGTVQSLAASPVEMGERIETLRREYQEFGHSRTPGMLARLVATAEAFLGIALEVGAITETEFKARSKEARKAITKAGESQAMYLEDSDPVEMFHNAIRQVLTIGAGHLRTMSGGVPAGAEMLGWTKEDAAGEMPRYRSRGPCIGWVDVNKDEIYIDVTSGYAVIRKVAGSELALTKQTLFKRLKDAGVLLRADETRQRNTIRITAEMHPRQVLAMSLASTLELKEAL